jgi:hypothetical protein
MSVSSTWAVARNPFGRRSHSRADLVEETVLLSSSLRVSCKFPHAPEAWDISAQPHGGTNSQTTRIGILIATRLAE